MELTLIKISGMRIKETQEINATRLVLTNEEMSIEFEKVIIEFTTYIIGIEYAL